jgi:cardiolipin synthase A/B
MRAATLAGLALAAATLGGCAAVQEMDARELAAYLESPPLGERAALVRGNQAAMLVDGPRTHDAMFDAMAGAQDHINLQSYILEGGEIGAQLARLAQQKVAQGVRVNILYDSVGSIGTPREYFARLRGHGAAVCEFNPVNPLRASIGWRLNSRDHRKILVVDGKVAFTGGINLSSAYSSGSRSNRPPRDVKPGEESARGWRDTQVRIEGPAVARFQRLFLDAWALQDCGPIAEGTYFPRLEPRGGQAVRVLSSDPGAGTSQMYRALLSAIGEAKQRVWLAFGYFVPDPWTVLALTEAARRGVDVRLVLPGFSDFWAPVYAGRSHYETLLRAGVRIFEWHEALMHAKTAVIDSQWASIGSTNLDWRSIVHNYEADLVVEDRAFARELERRFALDVKASEEVRLEKWEHRGMVERAKEWLARQWEYLL